MTLIYEREDAQAGSTIRSGRVRDLSLIHHMGEDRRALSLFAFLSFGAYGVLIW